MIAFLIAFTVFINPNPDSLTKACDCQIPDRFEAKKINKDTLVYFQNKKRYKPGLIHTLHYLNQDSTDLTLFNWLGYFSFNLGEKMLNNKKIREKRYKENPNVKHKVIQDTVGYIVFTARQNIGPRQWTRRIIPTLGSYALCSIKCQYKRNPSSKKVFNQYFHTLIALKKYDQAIELIKNHSINVNIDQESKVGSFFLALSRYHIAYRKYKQGLEYAKFIVNNFSISESKHNRWNNVFHYAIRNDDRIREQQKPYFHVKVEEYIPEIED